MCAVCKFINSKLHNLLQIRNFYFPTVNIINEKYSTLFTFFVISPLHVLFPNYNFTALFSISCILLVGLLTLQCTPERYIFIVFSVSAIFVLSTCTFFYFLLSFSMSVTFILLQQLIPKLLFSRIIKIILMTLLSRYILPIHIQLLVCVIGALTVLKINADLRKTVRCYVSFIGLLISTLFISLILLPVAAFRPRNIQNLMFCTYFTAALSWLFGIEWEIRNSENMIEYTDESAVVIANHQSALDVLGMFHVVRKLKIKCTAVGRKMIFWIWPLGLTLWLCGAIFIVRKHKFSKTHTQLNEASRIIIDQKAKIWIFPEGTRNSNPNVLLPFKKGAFRIAIENGIPIIPIMISPYYFVNWNEKYFESGKVILDIIKPIKTKGLTLQDLDSLIEGTYSMMAEKNRELREEIAREVIRT